MSAAAVRPGAVVAIGPHPYVTITGAWDLADGRVFIDYDEADATGVTHRSEAVRRADIRPVATRVAS